MTVVQSPAERAKRRIDDTARGAPPTHPRTVPIAAARAEAIAELCACEPGPGNWADAERMVLRTCSGSELDAEATVLAAANWLRVLQSPSEADLALPSVVAVLGVGMVSIGDRHAARQLWHVASSLPTATPALRAELALCRAQALFAMGRSRDAVAKLQLAADVIDIPATGPRVRSRAAISALAAGADRAAAQWSRSSRGEAAIAATTVEAAADLPDADAEAPLRIIALAVRGELAAATRAAERSVEALAARVETAIQAHTGADDAATDLEEFFEVSLLLAALYARSGRWRSVLDLLRNGSLPGSLTLRTPWLRLASIAARRADDPSAAAWSARELDHALNQWAQNDAAALRLDAKAEGPGFFEALTALGLDQWQRHASGLATLLDHDLRGPAQTASLALDVVRNRGAQDAVVQEATDMLGFALEAMARVSGSLPLLAAPRTPDHDNDPAEVVDGDALDLANGVSTALDAAPSRDAVPVLSTLQSQLDAVRPVLAAAGQSLVVELPALPGLFWEPITADGAGVVLDNLIRNASSASGRGDEITVRAYQECGSSIVVIEIGDAGVGFDPGGAGRLFTRGTRGNSARQVSDHGLGLYTVALVVARLGGTVTGHSDGVGTGATFRVALPVLHNGRTQIVEVDVAQLSVGG